jgi:hypothetical protein
MNTLKIFCCYAQEDQDLMERFHAHLRRVLELEQVSIEYPHNLPPGVEQASELARRLHSADIIMFLVSADFMNLDEHYEKEVKLAIERYNRGEARVIPIILRPVFWQDTPLGKLLPLPDGGKAVTDASWHTQDHAFVNIVEGIKRAIDGERTHRFAQQEKRTITPHSPGELARTDHDASTQLEQIIQSFKLLRAQIASFVLLKGPKDFSLESCENQYNKLYGDTMVFLATYLPESLSDDAEGFVEIVYRKMTEQLRKRDNVYVSFTRQILHSLAELEKLAEQIDACRATLEFYQQRYFMDPPVKPTNIRTNYHASRNGNEGTIIFDLNGRQHTLEYLRRDNISHQIFSLTRERQELVRLVVPFATIKSLKKEAEFQIDGVKGLFTLKMAAITSIMSVKVEIAGEEVFRT